MKTFPTLFMAFFILFCATAHATKITTFSPDKQTQVSLELKDNKPYWSMKYHETPIILPSELGITIKDTPFLNGFESISINKRTEDNTWKPVWGKTSSIRNNFNEITWKLKEKGTKNRSLSIIVRLYNQGIAIQYKIDGKGSLTFSTDHTHFTFSDNPTCWAANGEHANIGPVKLHDFKGSQFPLTLKINENIYCSILEAAIFDFAPISPKRVNSNTLRTHFHESTVNLPATTSWRVLLLGKTAGDLLTGNVLMNLNPPNQIKDNAWIKPGLAMWDWRAWGGKGANDFIYNLDMASWRRFIDFASKNNIHYLVLDANWYGHEFDKKSNPIKSRDYIVYQPNPKSPKMADKPASKDWKDPIDIPALIQYGKKQNVGIVLYINDVARNNYNFEETLATYQKWGAAGIKYGFMRAKGQKKVHDTRKIIELCAKYHLICDFHDGPVPPSGDRRTYPNYLTREFCHGQSDATRSFTPTTFCTTVFCNMLAGPLDMCNGFFTLDQLEKVRPKVFKPVYSTVVGEAARVLIVFSGLSILPDTPESYEAKADLFEFIAHLPMTWDETRILNSEIGKYITTARRSGYDWFIASSCNEDGAELSIHLDFLQPNGNYQAILYEDTPDTHYKTNREAYRIRKQIVKKGTILNVKLALGGGHCIRIVPIKK